MNWPPQTWLRSLGWTGTSIVDNAQSLASIYLGGPSYPFFVEQMIGVWPCSSSGDISASNFQQLSNLVAHN